MPSLYQIANDYLECFIEDENGEFSPDVAERLDALEADFTVKAENVCRYIRQCNADSEAFALEAKRLQLHAQIAANKADRLKDYLKESMERTGLTKCDTELFKLWIQRNGVPSVTLAEGMTPGMLPKEYQRLKIEADAKKIGDDFKAGKPMPEGVTAAIGFHLRIK